MSVTSTVVGLAGSSTLAGSTVCDAAPPVVPVAWETELSFDFAQPVSVKATAATSSTIHLDNLRMFMCFS
jgi:hypothetical protein